MTCPDITKLTYEKITDRYYKARYLGLECIMDTTNGYINATKLCSRDKTKIFLNYIQRTRYKILVTYYMTNVTEYSKELSIRVTDAPQQVRGTYLHPILFLDLAIWISPSAYTKASKIISDVLIKEINNEERLARLEKTLEDSIKERELSEKRSEEILLKIVLQNKKTHSNLISAEKNSDDLNRIKLSLKRVETNIEKLSEKNPKKFSFWKCKKTSDTK